MRYFNLTALSDSNARTLGGLITYKKLNRGLGVFDVSPKGKGKVFKGKLKAHDIDLIRYLNFIGISSKKISVYFSVCKGSICKTISRDIFRKHISPFEELVNKIHPRINYEKAEVFYINNKDEIDKILRSIK